MNKNAAYKLATQWGMVFGCRFYVIQISQGVYDVAARVTHWDNIVAEVG